MNLSTPEDDTPFHFQQLFLQGIYDITKAFYGTSENAVKTQIWIAVSVYVLVAILKKRLHLDLSLYTFLQIISVSLFEKLPIFQVLIQTGCATPVDDFSNV